MDSFGKIVALLISIVLLFITPLIYTAEKQDIITQNYIAFETTKFVDSIKNTGYLSDDMYFSFIKNLDATNLLYDIEIVHSHKVVEPIYDETTDTFLNDYNTYTYNTYQDEILEALDSIGSYYFTKEDYISVQLINKSKTFATKLKELLYSIDMIEEQIFVSYGGMIRDEAY